MFTLLQSERSDCAGYGNGRHGDATSDDDAAAVHPWAAADGHDGAAADDDGGPNGDDGRSTQHVWWNARRDGREGLVKTARICGSTRARIRM